MTSANHAATEHNLVTGTSGPADGDAGMRAGTACSCGPPPTRQATEE